MVQTSVQDLEGVAAGDLESLRGSLGSCPQKSASHAEQRAKPLPDEEAHLNDGEDSDELDDVDHGMTGEALQVRSAGVGTPALSREASPSERLPTFSAPGSPPTSPSIWNLGPFPVIGEFVPKSLVESSFRGGG